MRISMLILLIVFGASACTDRQDNPREAASSPAPVAERTPASTSGARQPAPAAATAQTGAPAPSGGDAMPAAGVIGYDGFGPAKFGATGEQIRMAWGREMTGDPEDPEGCYYLYPQPRTPDGFRLAFMIEGGRFVRFDVDTPDIAAPGGGRVGMTVEALHKRYADLREQPHKYVEGGRYLRRRDAGGGTLVFATDAGGKVTEWRLGVPPQVDYVEGCS